MNSFLKKTISFVLVLIISLGICLPTGAAKVSGAVPVEIGYSLSADKIYKGETVEVKFFFKNFEEANIDCTAFQLDVYVDSAIFTAESMKCTLDGTGAMMFTTKFNSGENKVKTVYFNPAQGLPKNSKDICTMSLKLNRDFEAATDVQLNITLAMVLDIDNNRYDVTYSSPVVKCLPLSEKPEEPSATPGTTPSGGSVIETISPSVSATPGTTGNDATTAPSANEYTVTYYDVNGRVIMSEKVKEGNAATNSSVPYRPGYIFVGWSVVAGTLKNVTSNMDVTAVYEVNDTLYTIEVEGGTVNGDGKSAKVKYDDCVVVELDESSVPEGKYFAGWKKSGSDKVVSFNKKYSFLATGSATVSPTYSDTEVKASPQTVLYNSVINADGVIFTSENYIPDGYSYSGSGIIVTKSDVIGGLDDVFVLNGQETVTYRSNKNSVNSQFSLVSSNLNDSFHVRSYLIYKNESGEKTTVYSDIGYYAPESI